MTLRVVIILKQHDTEKIKNKKDPLPSKHGSVLLLQIICMLCCVKFMHLDNVKSSGVEERASVWDFRGKTLHCKNIKTKGASFTSKLLIQRTNTDF